MEGTKVLRVAVGDCVRHTGCPDWGLGIVLSIRPDDKIDLYFEHHPSRAVVTLKSNPTLLQVTRTAPTDALLAFAAKPAGRAKTKAATPKAKRAAAEITQEEAVKRFLSRFPKGFRDPEYLASERDYKMAAHEIFANGLPVAERAKLLRKGEIANLVDRLQYIESRTNLLYPTEKARLRDGLKDHQAAARFIGALFALLDAPSVNEGMFEAYARAVESLPAPGGRVASWPVATIFPFLAQPERHMFLKPEGTKAAAQRLGINLFYKPQVNWRTYSQVLELGRTIKEELAPYGCRDMVDAQSFIWVVEALGGP
jgi:hypothetical protein